MTEINESQYSAELIKLRDEVRENILKLESIYEQLNALEANQTDNTSEKERLTEELHRQFKHTEKLKSKLSREFYRTI